MENGGGEKEWRKEKGVRSSSLRKHRRAASSSLTKERALSIRKHSGKDFIKPGNQRNFGFQSLVLVSGSSVESLSCRRPVTKSGGWGDHAPAHRPVVSRSTPRFSSNPTASKGNAKSALSQGSNSG